MIFDILTASNEYIREHILSNCCNDTKDIVLRIDEY